MATNTAIRRDSNTRKTTSSKETIVVPPSSRLGVTLELVAITRLAITQSRDS